MTGAARRRVLAAALLAVAALVTVAGVTAIGSDDRADGPGPLVWDGAPRVVTVPELPSDRILIGRVRNASLREIRLEADKVRVLGRGQRPLASTARFTVAFAHGLYSPRDAPAEVSAQEDERLGRVVTVRPGETVPLTLSWRLGRDGQAPVSARIGTLTLELPAER